MNKWVLRSLSIIMLTLSCIAIIDKFAHRGFYPGFDFRLRYYEVECLKTGLDPYLVWSEEVESPHYTSLRKSAPNDDVKFVNGYTPWSYTWLIPATNLPIGVLWRAYLCLSFLQVICLALIAYCIGKRIRQSYWDGILCCGASLFLGTMAGYSISIGNYSITLALCAYGLGWAFSRKNWWLQGLFLAVIMTKPQIGVLFVIPLLLNKQWEPVAFAAVVCLVLSIPPALLCNESPFTLIHEVAKLGGGAFKGTTLMPETISAAVAGKCGKQLPMALCAVIGVAICFALSFRLRKTTASAWIRILLAPILCSFLWTYTSGPDTILLSLVQVFLATELLKAKSIRDGIFPLAAIIMNASSFLMRFYDLPTPIPRFLFSYSWVCLRLLGNLFSILALWRLPNRDKA